MRERGHDRRRNLYLCQRDLRGARAGLRAVSSQHPGELLEVERVAPALLVERPYCRAVARRAAQQLVGLLGGERAQLHSCERPGAVRSLQRYGEALGHEAGSHREREEDGRRGRTA